MKRFEKEKTEWCPTATDPAQTRNAFEKVRHLRFWIAFVGGWGTHPRKLSFVTAEVPPCHRRGFIKPAPTYKQQQQLSETAKQSRKQFFLTLMRARKKIKCEIIFCVFPIGERGTPISSFSSLPTNDRRRRCNVVAVVTSCHAQLMFALKDTLSQKITK